MNKNIISLIVASALLIPFLGQAATSTYNLDKQTDVDNHYDANVFEYNNQVCAAGPYGNEIKVKCASLGSTSWSDKSDLTLTDSDAEFIGLDEVITFKNELYFIVDRGISTNSNNDTDTVEVWKYKDASWARVLSYANNSAYYIDSTQDEDNLYIVIKRYDTNPDVNLIYKTSNGDNWSKIKRNNTPKNITGITLNKGKLYAYNSSYLYLRRASGFWSKKYDITELNNDLEYNYINGLTNYQNKIYITTETYTYNNLTKAKDMQQRGITTTNDLGYEYTLKIKSSTNGDTWASKKLSDKSITGGELVYFRNDSDGKPYIYVKNYVKQRDVLWKVTKNVKKIASKKVIPKTSSMKSNSYTIIDYLKTGSYFYFSDSGGNIYTK